MTLAFLALLGAPYIYDISSLRVKGNFTNCGAIFRNTTICYSYCLRIIRKHHKFSYHVFCPSYEPAIRRFSTSLYIVPLLMRNVLVFYELRLHVSMSHVFCKTTVDGHSLRNWKPTDDVQRVIHNARVDEGLMFSADKCNSWITRVAYACRTN